MLLTGQWPPVQVSDYVPLILSLSDLSNFGGELVTNKINKVLKGDIDHVSNNIIKFKDIFVPDESKPNETINSILVQGSPGIGKTAFSLTVCKKWASGELFTQFQIVIFWALRDPCIQNFTSIDDLFFHDSKEISAAVVRHVRLNGGKGVLFVLDGWDELPDKFTKSQSSCFFLKLIEGEELPFSSIIVTSRNISSQMLLRHNFFNRAIDILGFSPECINAYIEKCCNTKPESEKQLKKLLVERPDILSISYVPMNCSIVCYVFSVTKSLPSTITELYDLLAKNSLLRNVELRGELSEDRVSFGADQLPDATNSLYLSLCKLAYHGLSISRYTYSRDDIAAACEASTGVLYDVDKLGVLQAVNVFHSEGVTSSFHFLHTTLQEFMAANYIASLSQEDMETVVMHHFSALSFKMVWQFYCGLLKDSNLLKNAFIAKLQIEAHEAAEIDSGLHDSFSCCSSDEEVYFSESDSEDAGSYYSQDEVIDEEVSLDLTEQTELQPGPNNGSLDFKQLETTPNEKFGSPDVASMVSVSLETSSQSKAFPESPPSTVLSFQSPTLTSPIGPSNLPPSTSLCIASGGDRAMPLVTAGGLEGVPSTLSNVRAVFVSKVNPYKHDRGQILFTLRCVHETQYQMLCSSLCDVLNSRLCFKNFSLSPGDINAIGFVVAKSNRKWQLNLVNCDLNTNHLTMVRHQFLKKRYSGKLTRLYLGGNNLDHSGISVLVEMLPVLKPLQKLFLGDNNLGDKSMESGAIPQLIKGLSSLTSLDLASNDITDCGINTLMKSLTSLKCLTHLDISNNSISPEGAGLVGDAISNMSMLQYLNIGGNSIKDIGIQSLSTSLSDSSSLQYLDLSNIDIGDEGIVILSSALQCNSSLRTLILHSNKGITCEGLGVLLALCTQSQLSTIDLNFCETGCNDALVAVFADCIPAFTALQSLGLSFNDLEDEGVSALINAISSSNHVTKLVLGGNSISIETLESLGYMICESTHLRKLCLTEGDLAITTEAFDEFCDCLTSSNSLQRIEICEVTSEQVLREKFKQVNNSRSIFAKDKLKVNYIPEL